jgi:hypothetical protein
MVFANAVLFAAAAQPLHAQQTSAAISAPALAGNADFLQPLSRLRSLIAALFSTETLTKNGSCLTHTLQDGVRPR